jgi:CheY-like chemotaxis protein
MVSVLLVEDDPSIRMSVCETLTEAGLDVIAASSAAEALAFPEAMEAPAVLITDAQLGPGMDGLALAAVARCRWPQIRTILISGDDESPLHTFGSIDKFLAKPFREVDLLQAIGPQRGAGLRQRISSG